MSSSWGLHWRLVEVLPAVHFPPRSLVVDLCTSLLPRACASSGGAGSNAMTGKYAILTPGLQDCHLSTPPPKPPRPRGARFCSSPLVARSKARALFISLQVTAATPLSLALSGLGTTRCVRYGSVAVRRAEGEGSGGGTDPAASLAGVRFKESLAVPGRTSWRCLCAIKSDLLSSPSNFSWDAVS